MRSTPSEARTQLQQDDKATHKPVNHKQERGVVCGVSAVKESSKAREGQGTRCQRGVIVSECQFAASREASLWNPQMTGGQDWRSVRGIEVRRSNSRIWLNAES